MSTIAEQPRAEHAGNDPQPGPVVTITVNDEPKSIHRGHQTVAAIKQAGGVPPADDLDQVIDGNLVPLKDDGAVTVKGGEVFVSHPKDGGSS
jgi:hypothetical protein